MPLPNLGMWDPNSPLNPNNPANVTPETIQAQRELAAKLMGGSMGGLPTGRSGPFEAVSPLGGLSNMAQALLGPSMLARTGQLQRGLAAEGAGATLGAPVPGAPGGQQYSGDNSDTASMIRDAAVQHGYQDPNVPVHVASTEGLNSYVGDEGTSFGPFQLHYGGMVKGPNSVSGLGDQFTKETGLHAADPRTVPQQVHWVLDHVKNSGDGWAPFHGWKGDQFAGIPPSGAQAGTQQAGRQPINPQTPAGGQALAFNGPPGQAPLNPIGSPAPMATALSGQPASGEQVAARGAPIQPPVPGAPNLGVPQTAPVGGQPGQPTIPTSLFPQRQQMSRDQAMRILSMPPGVVPDNVRNWAIESYYGQYQPVTMKGPYGSTYTYSPATGQQLSMPGDIHWGEQQIGDIKRPYPQAVLPPGSSFGPPIVATPQRISPPGSPPGGGAAPIQSPSAPEAPINLGPQPGSAPGKGSQNEEAPAKTRLAALETDTASDAAPPGMPGAPPIPSGGSAGAPPVAMPTTAPPGASVPPGQQTAQNINFDTATDEELANWSQQRHINTETAIAQNKADVENYNKDYGNYQTLGMKAINAAPSIALARKIIEDPHFTQGPGTDIKLAWAGAKAFFGDKAAANELAYNQTFDKVISQNILGDMRAQLQGLGQVRLAEIALLNRAAASKYNTIGANRAILQLSGMYQKQLEDIGKITNQYRMGYRWDAKGNPITDTQGIPVLSGERPTSVGQDAAVRQYLINNPLLNKDQITQYQKIFENDDKVGSGGAPPPPGAKKVPAPGQQ